MSIPNILLTIRDYIKSQDIIFSNLSSDGRINSANDEKLIVDKLIKEFPDHVKAQKKRHWFDIAVKDNETWLPVNIKITEMESADNVGNLALCVQAYTNIQLDLCSSYQNGKLADVLVKALKNGQINDNPKKDYWFLVINKKNNKVYVNSVLGLTHLTANSNNLPFQINWKHNTEYDNRNTIIISLNKFIEVTRVTKKTWQTVFIDNMSKLHINQPTDPNQPTDINQPTDTNQPTDPTNSKKCGITQK